ncbi:hypothetical protein L3Y34_011175 [Caenorhabditis briggsae]|uniref:BTB domain-containing protein n=1 Tax=Caenorhabditis briggsae TaxID=6238 RepID=A0AAE8ZR48_CAEBR|nr:hypothetical protein L3Y34_011175 [Caenorhabditis briggsae]
MTGDIQTQPISDALQSKINLFRTTTDLRTFQINTQTDTIFVNLNYLAEISEYFHILRTGSYTEKTSEKVILDDVFTEELVIFLSYACPEGFEFDRTINQQNITALAYFSDRFMVPWVKQEIKKYFKSEDFKHEIYDTEMLIQLCYLLRAQSYASVDSRCPQTSNECYFSSADIDPVFQKIARYGDVAAVDKAVAILPDKESRIYIGERIIFFRPYTFTVRPQSYFNWNDNRARLFF